MYICFLHNNYNQPKENLNKQNIKIPLKHSQKLRSDQNGGSGEETDMQ